MLVGDTVGEPLQIHGIATGAKRMRVWRPCSKHPYTEALLSAVPVPDPKIKRAKRVLEGDVPSPVTPPSGCHFHTRCPYAEERCRQEVPQLKRVGAGHYVSCHLRS
jgi:oligopeptide/dipeptide ABC transporter ATP-binding protein